MTLWIPDTAKPIELKAAFFCRVCKKEFTERERHQYTQHVIKCGDEHMDDLMAQREPLRRWNTPVDPEWEAWNRDLERRGIDPAKQWDRKRKNGVKKLRES